MGQEEYNPKTLKEGEVGKLAGAISPQEKRGRVEVEVGRT